MQKGKTQHTESFAPIEIYVYIRNQLCVCVYISHTFRWECKCVNASKKALTRRSQVGTARHGTAMPESTGKMSTKFYIPSYRLEMSLIWIRIPNIPRILIIWNKFEFISIERGSRRKATDNRFTLFLIAFYVYCFLSLSGQMRNERKNAPALSFSTGTCPFLPRLHFRPSLFHLSASHAPSFSLSLSIFLYRLLLCPPPPISRSLLTFMKILTFRKCFRKITLSGKISAESKLIAFSFVD